MSRQLDRLYFLTDFTFSLSIPSLRKGLDDQYRQHAAVTTSNQLANCQAIALYIPVYDRTKCDGRDSSVHRGQSHMTGLFQERELTM